MIVAVVVAALFIVSLVPGACGRGGSQQTEVKEPTSPTIAQIGETKITAAQLDTQITQMRNSFGGAVLSPRLEGDILGFAVMGALQGAVGTELARKAGIKISDDEIGKEVDTAIAAEVMNLRQQLISEKKLKENATDAELAAVFKKETNRDLESVKAEAKKRSLEDPNQRAQVEQQILSRKLVEKYEADAKFSDEDVKLSRQTVTAQRVFIPKSSTKGDPSERIKKAEAEIKGGKAFGDVVAAYSEDLPEPNKSLKDSTTPIQMGIVLSTPAMAPLKTLREGQVSPIIELPEGFAIYKFTKVTKISQADFDKNKAQFTKDLAREAAQVRLGNERRELSKPENIQWKSIGMKAVYTLAMGPSQAMGDKAKLDKLNQEVLAMTGDPADEFGNRALAFAKLKASDALWGQADEAKKKTQVDTRLEVLQAVLGYTESAEVRLDQVEALKLKGDATAGETLAQAAAMNTQYDEAGKGINDRINQLLVDLEKGKLINPDQKTALVNAQTEWKKNYDMMLAEKKRQEEELKKQEEAAKKAAEEEKKKAASGGSKPAPPSSESLTQPAPPQAPQGAPNPLGGGQ